jgi:hypothetical protein
MKKASQICRQYALSHDEFLLLCDLWADLKKWGEVALPLLERTTTGCRLTFHSSSARFAVELTKGGPLYRTCNQTRPAGQPEASARLLVGSIERPAFGRRLLFAGPSEDTASWETLRELVIASQGWSIETLEQKTELIGIAA